MTDIMNILWIMFASLIGVLHIISPLVDKSSEKIISYIALFLHIPLFVFLLLAKEELEVVAIVITLSLFVYIVANTLIPFLKRLIGSKDADTTADGGEENGNDI